MVCNYECMKPWVLYYECMSVWVCKLVLFVGDMMTLLMKKDILSEDVTRSVYHIVSYSHSLIPIPLCGCFILIPVLSYSHSTCSFCHVLIPVLSYSHSVISIPILSYSD